MIDKDVCNEQIYKNGESYDARVDLTNQQANDFCEKLTNDSEEYAYDWHYFEDVDLFQYCPYCGGEIEFSEVEL